MYIFLQIIIGGNKKHIEDKVPEYPDSVLSLHWIMWIWALELKLQDLATNSQQKGLSINHSGNMTLLSNILLKALFALFFSEYHSWYHNISGKPLGTNGENHDRMAYWD